MISEYIQNIANELRDMKEKGFVQGKFFHVEWDLRINQLRGYLNKAEDELHFIRRTQARIKDFVAGVSDNLLEEQNKVEEEIAFIKEILND